MLTKEQKEEKKEKYLTANVTVGLGLSLNAEWDEIGPYLHALQSMMHQCLNDAVSRVAIEAEKATIPELEGMKLGPAAYKAIEERVEQNHNYYSKRFEDLMNGKVNKDGKKMPGFEVREKNHDEEIDKAKKWLAKKPADPKRQARVEKAENALKKLQSEKKRLEEKSRIKLLSSNIKDDLASKAISAYRKWRSESLLGTRSLPTFNNTSPIYLRDSSASWTIHRDKKGYVLSMKLYPGRTGKICFGLKEVNGSAHAHLKRMIDEKAIESGQHKLGNMKLIWKNKKRKWVAQLCYSWERPAPKPLDMSRIVAVRRGIRSFMVMGATGKNPDIRTWIDGGDIIAAKHQFKNRIKKEKKYSKKRKSDNVITRKQQFSNHIGSLQRHRRELGTAALKHGKTRKEQRVVLMRNKERDWIKTKCQRAAAYLRKFILKHEAGLLAIEDWSRPVSEQQLAMIENEHMRKIIEKFPFYQLKEAVKWAVEKEGVKVVEVSMKDTYTTCPKCGYKDDGNYTKATRTFECLKCKTKRPVEQIMVWHILKRAGGTKVDKAMEKVNLDVTEGATGRTGEIITADEKATKKAVKKAGKNNGRNNSKSQKAKSKKTRKENTEWQDQL